jgi:mobilome CxxCx(11)CxxC protein
MDDFLNQTRMNALAAKILHCNGIKKYKILSKVYLISTIIIPLFFIIALYISKGTGFESIINIISFILSIFLISYSVYSLIIKIDDMLIAHKSGMKDNIFILSEASRLLISTVSKDEDMEWFRRYCSEIDARDNEIFSTLKAEKKREAYLEALKEFDPGDYSILCPICESSPWKFEKGECQLCGNKIKK